MNGTDTFYQVHSAWAFIAQQGSAPGSGPGGTTALPSVTLTREDGWKDDRFG